ncbi:hypothetical protein G7Y89_g13939 [Cudoniella acicularis]|uniref:Heterokaryon incompatibility domain-containing protein n=1 Tax=Cudoniella acicularis TaxID=354080 RepID=A0A8H4R8J6_9HELO|nr:hypothetical protein G7Y89_g13939 [Cudoniella acicularis]
MGCNCLKSSKADNEEQATLTPRIVRSASRNHASQPPMTKSSVPQRCSAGAEVKDTPAGQKIVATKTIIDGEAVDVTNPSLSPVVKTVHGSTDNAEISSPNKLSKSNTVSSTSVHSAASPKSAHDESTSLWKAAYDEVKNTDPSLIEDLETVIKADASISAEADLKEQIALVVKVQKDRMESKQWSFPWFGKTLKIRELMMSDAEKHQEALKGLERVTKILWCYAAADRALFEDPTTRDAYSKALLPLYIELLKYNCTAAQYFSQKTLKRIWKNTTGSTSWSDNSAQIIILDDDCRRAIQILGFGRLQHLLGNQRLVLEQILKSAHSSRIEKQEILSWMSTVPYGADHENVRENLGKLYQSSGQWIFRHSKFQEWQNSDSGIFVLRGTAGTGKSSLTSIVIQALLDNPNGYLAYFYCSRKEKTTQRNDTTMVVRTLVKALSVSGHPAFEAFSENYRNSETQRAGGCQLQLQSCLSLLSKSLDDNPLKSVVFVIDAIDECAQPAALLSALNEIRGSNTQARNIRIFMSSRDGPDIEVHFPDIVEVDIAKNNGDDIRSYLGTEIPYRRKLDRDSVMTDSQALELQKVLHEYANGMFQWVVLEIEIFLSKIDDAKIALEETIDAKIENLKMSELEPIDQLDEAYDQIYAASVGRNDPGRRVVVDNALQWLLCSYRDLNIEELLIAVSIKRDGTKYRNLRKRKLRNLLSNFLTEGPSGEVRLAHLTIRPYLEKRTVDGQFIFGFSNINLTAALTCLHMMRFSSAEGTHLQDDSIIEMEDCDSVNVKGFKAYSSFYWSSHSRAASKSKKHPKELQELLESMYGSIKSGPSDGFTWTPFHNAIEQGQNEAVEYLIASNVSLDQQDKLGNTPLHEAVQYKNSQAIQLLLQGGAMIQIKNNNGNTPLHLAAFTSDYGIVHQLLREEASPNEVNLSGQAPIHVAVLHGCTEAVRAFISAGVDIDFRDHLKNSALHYAVVTNQSNIASMLIQVGCAMNPQNEDGNSPLHFATRIASKALSTLLLRNAAIVDIRNREIQTPIDSGFLTGLPSEVTRTLLEALAIEKTTPKVLPKYEFDVETLGLCSKCESFPFWLNTSAQSMYHEHHSSYRALQQSADKGCRLCDVISKSILADMGSIPTDQQATYLAVKFVLSRDHEDGNSQDLFMVRMGPEIVTSLELFVAKANNNVAEDIDGRIILSGRPTAKCPYIETCFPLVRQWISECNSQHHQTCHSLSNPLPKRLINVGEAEISEPRLELTLPGQRGSYIWLSYSWGVVNPPQTTTKNLSYFIRGISFQTLPKTFQDAIYLARKLGISYIYIDALCVIHDDPEDKAAEMPMLARYVAGATFTFAAISLSDPSGGLFGQRSDVNSLLSLRILSPTGQASSNPNFIQLRRPLKTPEQCLPDFVLSRGWLVQEIILSQRLLFFHPDQVFWNCNLCLRSEGNSTSQQPILRLGMGATATIEFDIAQQNYLMPWYSLIELFSQTTLTYTPDRLIALSGIAHCVQDELGIQYAAGIWREDLVRGLLWRYQTKDSLKPPGLYIAPSWSWAALVGPLSYSFARSVYSLSTGNSSYKDAALQIIDISLNIRSEDMFGEIWGDYINLSAMTRSLSDADPLDHLECFFDLLEYEKAFLEGSKEYNCVIIAQHYLGITDKGSRWIGLLVEEGTTESDPLELTRVGLFVGPTLDRPLDKWVRREIKIY